MIIRNIYYMLNSSQRQLIRRLAFLPYDLSVKLYGKRKSLIPDRGLNFSGRGDYLTGGKKFLGYFINYGGLQPHHHVLEVGSGIGRMAVALIDFLDHAGSYKGFDIVKKGVEWCRENVSTANPSFEFRYFDIYNDLYNTGGKIKATAFNFPYTDHEFDFVIVTSVFTHMLNDEVLHYLDEMSRIMKKGAKSLVTFFLLNDQSKKLIQSGNSRFTFPIQFENYRIMNKYTLAGNVSYEEDFIVTALESRHFKINHILHGSWCGRMKGEFIDFQDIMIIEKT